MKKPFKILSSAALASVFATSAIVPVAAADAPVQYSLDEVVFNQDGKLISLPLETYNGAFEAEILDAQNLGYIKTQSGNYYTIEQYNAAFEAGETIEKAIEILEEKSTPSNLDKVYEGKIVDGKLVAADEQPEDRLNETFFYNVA